MPSLTQPIRIVVSLIIIATILPIGIGLVSAMGDAMVTINGTAVALSTVADPTVITLLEILLPILVVIGIIMGFLRATK